MLKLKLFVEENKELRMTEVRKDEIVLPNRKG